VTYALDVSDANVTARIDFGDESRAFAGNNIAPDDVEIFGQPAH